MMAKLDSIKEKVNVAEDFARKIWLAGLGAYGKGYDEAKGRFEELNADASKMFDELVGKGEKLEADAKQKFQEKADEFKSKTDFNISDRVAEVREKLGLNASDTEDKIDELSKKIDALTKTVTKLTKK